MILPDTLRPLPVAADEPSAAELSAGWDEDFVSVGAVRKVLLGESAGAARMPVSTGPARHSGCFASRADISLPAPEDIFIAEDIFDEGSRLASVPPIADRRVPDAAFDPASVHPAFRLMASGRRAAAPQVPLSSDWEARFGKTRSTERWWIFGMVLSLVAILLSGVLVDFLSRRATSPDAVRPEPAIVTPAAPAPGKTSASEVASIREPD